MDNKLSQNNKDLFILMKKLKDKNVPDEKNYARTQLIENNLNFVNFVIKRYFSSSHEDFEELLSMGRIGYVKAIDSYNLDKNIKFSSYASKYIRNEIYTHYYLNSMEKRKTDKVTYSMFEPLWTSNNEEPILLADSIFFAEKENFVDKVVLKLYAKQVIYDNFIYLTPGEQICLKIFAADDDTKRTSLNCSNQRYHQLIDKALLKLKLLNKNDKDCSPEELKKKSLFLSKTYPLVNSIEELNEYNRRNHNIRFNYAKENAK